MSNLEQAIQTLAQLDPDYQAFNATLPPEVSDIDFPDRLVNDVANLLQPENPELFSRILTQPPRSRSLEKFAVDPLAAAVTLAAILFLLRTHIKIEGKNFIFEHKPMGNKLLEKVLDALKGILPPSTKG